MGSAAQISESLVSRSVRLARLPSHDDLGPTSPAYLLHSQATITSRMYESYDSRYHHSWDVSAGGDGVIQVHEPQKGEYQTTHPKPADLHIERDVVEKLVNAYFTDVAPLLPVVTREEFLASSPPPPILLYSMCLVAAARRDVSQQVFESIRYAVNALIKAEDVLSTASIVNVQSLLILCMVGDCHSQFVPQALSALWVRLGCAIRMVRGPYSLPSDRAGKRCAKDGMFFPCPCRHRTLVCTERRLSSSTLSCGGDCGPCA